MMGGDLLEALGAAGVWAVAALASGALLGAYALYRLRGWTRTRIRRLKGFDFEPPIATESPEAELVESQVKQALHSVQFQYTVTQRGAVFGLAVVTLSAAAIPFLGEVPAAALSLVVGSLTVLVGMALKPVVENFFAGLVASFSKVLNIGDTVLLDGHYGTIEDISLTHTTIKEWDWRRYVIPNSRIMDSSFINYTVRDSFMWTYVVFWVGYSADLELVRELALQAPRGSSAYRDHEPPQMWIMELEPQGYRCWLAAWADTPGEGWTLKSDTREALVKSFREHGVPMPRYPVALESGGPGSPPPGFPPPSGVGSDAAS